MSQMFGLAVMRLADAQVLPFRYSHYARKISEFLDSAASWTREQDGNEIAKLDLGASKALAAEIAARAEALEHRADADLEAGRGTDEARASLDRKSTRLNSSD